MRTVQQQWLSALDRRARQGNLRTLRTGAGGADFCSNDYLGFAGDEAFREGLRQIVHAHPGCLAGATGARLICGHTDLTEAVEVFIARQHQAEAALLFPSGYKANLALLSCIAGRHDTILVDELVHRSVHDGCRLSAAVQWKFRHNDLQHLEELLKRARGNVFVMVESLYSMDGDFAPLDALAGLTRQYGAELIVDEAHAVGVFGRGLVHRDQLQDAVLAVVVTYGKALGVYGAAVLGSRLLKDYLVNFAAPFIYSTAMPEVQLHSIRHAYAFMDAHPFWRKALQERIGHFRSHGVHSVSADGSPIQIVRLGSADRLRIAAAALQEQGFRTYAVFVPAVKAGTERLRICLHRFNMLSEIDGLCKVIKNFQ